MHTGGTELSAAATLPHATPAPREATWKQWLPLLGLQALVALIVLFPFITGVLNFAFLDIASDTYHSMTGGMHLARLLGREGFSGWSFSLGLGAPVVFMFNDPFGLLSQLGGAEHVADLRIWVYLLKIALGGGFFFLFARGWVERKESALLVALAYSFCGYIVSNGVWDSETSIYVFAPLVLWGIQRHLRHGDVVTFPLAVAAVLSTGVFFLMVGVSLAVAGAVCVAASEDPRAMLRTWLTRMVPLAALGFLLAAPYVIPMALQLLDSPRVGGGTASALSRVAGEAFAVTDLSMLLLQVGGLFHKDIFGIGGFHRSYMNYLESPGFYVGMLPLLVIPQLWRGTPAQRRMLVAGLTAIALYMLLPVFRLAAFGFAVPYFRGTLIWVTLGLLVLATPALDRVLTRGADLPMLAVGAGAVWLLLLAMAFFPPASGEHAVRMAVFIAAGAAALALATRVRGLQAKLPSILLALMIVELVTTAWPSYYVMRTHVRPDERPYDDVTLPALDAIRADKPPLFYRVEKTFDTFGLGDAMAQDYRGVKSYYYHGRGIVNFHAGVDMLLDGGSKRAVNFTNWLPPPGNRFMLQSVLGVRYIVSHYPLDWVGLEKVGSGKDWFAYRNELAFPLGVVHTKQVTAAEMASLSSLPIERARWLKDLALVNAVVVDTPMPQLGGRFDLAAVADKGVVNVPEHYLQPAQALQRTGLQVTQFSDDHFKGTIHPDAPGILVFSIPASRGWQLRIDGQPVDWMTANFGMIAAPVTAGKLEVEMRYRLPGLVPGLLLGALAVAVLVLLQRRRRATREPTAPTHRRAAGADTRQANIPE
ncbi:YfhO family protein [Ramlibacter albus]|uniref:YfhO family protein n=1 Tax=Ramlibacter albus TaxID=2079448 RepID=A0A923S0R3_9BURK|nr:YfhO family protein [Ramlibacter albus]MBC5763639.1 YfhO family protein [Ramlibacter albus]